MTEPKKYIEDLIAKAAKAQVSTDAVHFAQAALNAANALIGLSTLTDKK